jgi:hypothetical protein
MEKMESSCFDFGFDEAKVIKNVGCELFKQGKAGEKSRITVISFRRLHDNVLLIKTREKGSALTDPEKAEYITKIDTKIAERLGKKVSDLTEVDRLDLKQPKFSFAYTHFKDGIGTIRCKGKYENIPGQGPTLVKPAICDEHMGDAEQTVGCVILQYPIDSEGQVDLELFKVKKYTHIFIWKMGSKKFKKLESVYVDARKDRRETIDLRIELDGDPKFQKQNINYASDATFALDIIDPALRQWVLEQGLRNYKYVEGHLGYAMPMDKLLEKLGKTPASGDTDARPQLQAGYRALID